MTCIVIIRKPSELAGAADSKANIGLGGESSSLCKFKQVGSVFIAAAGLYSNSATGFDLYSVALTACQGRSTIQEKADRFARQVQEPLIRALKRIQSIDPEYYRRRLPEGREVVQVAFFGFEVGAPRLHVRAATLRNQKLVITRKDCPGGDCVQNTMAAILGSSDGAYSYINAHPEIQDIDLAQATNKLVEAEIRNNPNEVGGPVDILRIDKTGARWVQKKPSCPRIRSR